MGFLMPGTSVSHTIWFIVSILVATSLSFTLWGMTSLYSSNLNQQGQDQAAQLLTDIEIVNDPEIVPFKDDGGSPGDPAGDSDLDPGDDELYIYVKNTGEAKLQTSTAYVFVFINGQAFTPTGVRSISGAALTSWTQGVTALIMVNPTATYNEATLEAGDHKMSVVVTNADAASAHAQDSIDFRVDTT